MINKKIEDINESDLQALIDNKVLEGKTVEYKKELPNNSDSDKKEFLADVTSFANSSGGDLIYGIAQDNQTGEPEAIDGIDVNNIDNEKTRLDNIIRDGVEPRILSIHIKPIPLGDSKYAILIRIPKSWISPHRVIFGGHAKFYARNSSGKYDMDVDELRVSFNLSETITDRIRNFRTDRIAKIIANETPVILYPNPKIVLHLIPVNAFDPAQKYNIDTIYNNRHDKLPLIYKSVLDGRYNLDGLFTYSGSQEEGRYKYSAFTQLFRNGIIEAVDAQMLKPRVTKNGEMKIIPTPQFEEKLINITSSYLNLLSELTISSPIYVFLSLLQIHNYKIYNGSIYEDISTLPIDRDLLLLPETIVNNYDVSVAKMLRPLFDLVWNACGCQRSLNYDEHGDWISR